MPTALKKSPTAERDAYIGARASTDEREVMELIANKMEVRNLSCLIRALVKEKAVELNIDEAKIRRLRAA